MKTLIVGDIHGCYTELQELIEKSGLSEGDVLIATGDIVDRGPDTPQILNFFRHQPKTRTLMGNHERKHVRAARGEVKLSLSQIITRSQLGDAYCEAVDWMGALPLYLELPEAILVHGYLEPGIPLELQLPVVLCGTMGGDKHLRRRYDRPWYELYTGEKPVIVGHDDYLQNGQAFVYQERIFGLDTSCVHGKTLTGLILPDFTIISTPSRGDYWYFVRKEHRRTDPSRPRKPKAEVTILPWDEESEGILREMLDLAAEENKRVLARLHEQPGFENLAPRKQAQAYAVEIGNTPWAILLHLARRGELDVVKARQVLINPGRMLEIAKKIGLR